MSADVLTIGHSNLPVDRFLATIKAHGVTAVADVRSVPFSRRFPWFSARPLAARLQSQQIAYTFMGDTLGGRPADPWLYRDGVADYEAMATTPSFRSSLDHVTADMRRHRLCLMCAEREPLDCHRCLLVGRALAERGYSVGHIRGDGEVELHSGTEQRLLTGSRQADDLFGDRSRRLTEAYRQRARRIAARLADRARPAEPRKR